MKCEDFVHLISDYLEGHLTNEELQKEFDEHYSKCPNCKRFFEQFKKTLNWTQNYCKEFRATHIPPSVKKKILDLIEQTDFSQ